ncbi:MAG: DegT/DnrJ/EryC1/StrS family aminotransferase [Candidatus Omnitrophica bacterium]|nr:DegT/DnrJ/EryC1/StrS family aminotransferase [Candidatus Omnitrophota bacterium]
MSVPFFDLRRQYRVLRPAMDAALRRVCASGAFILGPEGRALESELARLCWVPHAVGTASGTDALELALQALGLGPGDEVITTPLTFIATAQAISHTGARPVFADVDPVTATLDPARVARAMTRRTRAILPVHLYGQPCDMAPLLRLAKRRGLHVVEDCAQAIGATFQGRPVGSFGDAGAFSFYPTKNLGAYGDAGAVVTRSRGLAARLRMLRQHGSADRVRYPMLGRNSRLDELQAAVLRVKLRHLRAWNVARRRHAATYRRLFRRAGIAGAVGLPAERAGRQHVYHHFVIRVRRRDALQRYLEGRGIGCGIYYAPPLHLQPLYRVLGYRRGEFPVAERFSQEILSLPMYPELTASQLSRVVDAVRAFMQRRSTS